MKFNFKNIFISATAFTLVSCASYKPQPEKVVAYTENTIQRKIASKEGYAVGMATDGKYYCFAVNEDGNIYGEVQPLDLCQIDYKVFNNQCYKVNAETGTKTLAKLEDCLSSYSIALAADNIKSCFMTDIYGRPYGSAIRELYMPCSPKYIAKVASDGVPQCYQINAKQAHFGPVDKKLCGDIFNFRASKGTDGKNHCYRVDPEGVVFGTAVNPSACQFSFKLSDEKDGPKYCLRADIYGTAYGAPVQDSACQVGFKAALINMKTGLFTKKDVMKCFMADVSGITYGGPVNESVCQVSFKVSTAEDGWKKCFSADKEGTVFGMPVADSVCSVGFKVGKGKYGSMQCLFVDKEGVTYGNPVQDSACRDN